MEPALGTAYIVRQFKRPEEIDAMRRVYGRKFIQVSVYGSPMDRRRVIMDKIASFDSSPKEDSDREGQAIDLIATDANQADEENGQRVSEVFLTLPPGTPSFSTKLRLAGDGYEEEPFL